MNVGVWERGVSVSGMLSNHTSAHYSFLEQPVNSRNR
jgi:hypothetical protein